MTEASTLPPAEAVREHWLVVDPLATAPADFTTLLTEIQRRFGVDLYTARQRLLGRGYTLFLRGSSDKLTPLLELLHAHTIPAQLLEPIRPKSHPPKLQSLQRSENVLTLVSGNSELTIHREIYVIAVFADLSGTVVANGVKQLLVRNAYQGADAAATRSHDEEALCQAISRAKPVLDLYLLGARGERLGAVRVLPGRYDPEGLGAARTLSAGLNLIALIDVARSCAKSLTLRSDFGLANLPGCQLETPLNDINLDKNLIALSRFGTIAAQFVGKRQQEKLQSPEPQSLPGLPLIPGLPPLPLLHQTPGNKVAPVASETEQAPQRRTLPPPPDDRRAASHPALRFWMYGVMALILFSGWTILQKGPGHWWSGLLRLAMESGLLPALLAGFLLWRGFATVHLKRRIENTPVSRIRSLATGMVEVFGRTERCYALVTPVTQAPCIYYRLLRYQRDRNGKWQLSSQRTSGLHPFWLSDDTGKVLVDPLAADLRPAHRQEGSGDGLNNAFFDRDRQPDSDEKWVEESIPEGEMLYVLGFSAPRRRSGESLHEATGARLRALKLSPELRQRFDKNNDGKIDTDEWDEARRVVAGEVAKTHLKGQQERRKQEESLVIGAPPRRSLPFLIAQSLNEKAVTRTLWWQALALFFAGLLLSGWALQQLLHFLPTAGH